MNWIFWAFIGAAVFHVGEEYYYPGGFPDFMKRVNPGFAPSITVTFAVVINALFLMLCLAGAIIADRNLIFSLSVASLLFFNGLSHIMGTVIAKRYAPGVISGIVLYLPLSLSAYYLFVSSGRLTLMVGIISVLLGVLYQAVPVSYLILSNITKRT
jgi:hypothetical protein